MMMADKKEQARKFTWNTGDLDIRKEGDGPELIPEEDIEDILREGDPDYGRPDPGFRPARDREGA